VSAVTNDGWRRVALSRLAHRTDPVMARARRWIWVEWTRKGEARRLALLTPLASRLGLLEFTLRLRGRRGAWIRPLRVSESKEKAAAKL
jgi:hypothetical protein